MVATAIYSVTMVLWKETAFPLCRGMERHWKRNVVSLVSSVIVVIRLPILSTIIIVSLVCAAFAVDSSHMTDSVHLQILLIGTCRQRGSRSVAGHNHRKVIGRDAICAS